MTGKYTKTVNWIRRYHGPSNIFVFLLVFATFGGGLLLIRSSAATNWVSGHSAQCVQNSPSHNIVRPGQQFTAQVKMKNTGNSTFSPSYGFYLGEFNNGAQTNYWKAQYGGMTSNVGPGGTATFNLVVTAPSSPGFYPFNWVMAIYPQGVIHDPCVNKEVIVVNPPQVTLNLNGNAGNITVGQNSGLTLSWSASNGASSCAASGNWSGGKPVSGSENRTGDTSTAGTKTYSLQCNNAVGSGSVTRTVTVSPASSSGGSSGGSSSTSIRSTSSSSGSSSASQPISDKSPPSTPSSFKGFFSQSAVELEWQASSDDFGVVGYEMERSTDQSNWQKLGDTITSQAFTDSSVVYQTTYYYRLAALDAAGNKSDYATMQITTGSFDPNYNGEEDLVITSTDGLVKITIPSGALDESASCVLRSSLYLHPNVENFVSLTGPYELVCKLASGERASDLSPGVNVELELNEKQKKQYSEIKFYVRGEEDWSEIEETSSDNGFVLSESADFAVMAKTKRSPVWQKVLLVLFILIAVVVGGLFVASRVYRWHVKRKFEKLNEEAYNKEHGY